MYEFAGEEKYMFGMWSRHGVSLTVGKAFNFYEETFSCFSGTMEKKNVYLFT